MQIRQMEMRDSEQVAKLCVQWGYNVGTEQVKETMEQISQSSGHALFVAEIEGVVCGWVHVQGVLSLGSDPYVEIRGIVVDENHRQQGIGRHLIAQAESWTAENGYRIIRLRSSTSRIEAHHFYPKLGFDRTKTQHVYQKKLG